MCVCQKKRRITTGNTMKTPENILKPSPMCAYTEGEGRKLKCLQVAAPVSQVTPAGRAVCS